MWGAGGSLTQLELPLGSGDKSHFREHSLCGITCKSYELSMMACMVCSTTAHKEHNNLMPSQKWWLLQHARFGHASVDRMRPTMKHRSMSNARGLKLSELPCEACNSSKACRKAHKGKLHCALHTMGLIHVDLHWQCPLHCRFLTLTVTPSKQS